VDHVGTQMLEVQVDMVAMRADATALIDLDRHRARNDVARCEVLRVRCVALHEAFAGRVGEIAALAAHSLGDQTPGAIDAGRVELHEFHVLQGQPRAQQHAAAVAGARVRRGAGEIRPPVAAGRKYRGLRAEAMQRTVRHVERDDAATDPVLHHEIDRKVLGEEPCLVPERLLIERMQHRVPGAVRRRAGPLRDALAVVRRHAAERALIDAPVLGAREGHAVVLELDHRGRTLATHELDRVLIAQPVRSLDRVVEMEAPVVLAHVAERGADTALRRHRVAAGREYLGDAGGRQPRLRETERGPQSRAAGADHHHVVGVVDEGIAAHPAAPMASRSTAMAAAAAASTNANFIATSAATRTPLAPT
jgi:hypothetical protein